MKVIFAQGNPGEKYSNNRHNAGWLYLDALANKNNVSFLQKPKFKAEIAEINHDSDKVLLVKPTTFYNDTGLSCRALADFFKLQPEDFLIVHDDLALPIGTIRTRQGGSSAGNNGIKSIISHLGENTARLRIGVFSDLTTAGNNVRSVLSNFSEQERSILKQLEPVVMTVIDKFIINQFPKTTYFYDISSGSLTA